MLRKITLFTFIFLVCQFALSDQALDTTLAYAQKGDAKAQSNLGHMYCVGKCVVQNFKQVVKWYAKAAEQGYAEPQSNRGYMLHMRSGTHMPIHNVGRNTDV